MSLSKSKIFLLILFSFFLGIFISSFFISQFFGAAQAKHFGLSFLIFGIALVGIFWGKNSKISDGQKLENNVGSLAFRKYKTSNLLILVGFLLIFLSFGLFRYFNAEKLSEIQENSQKTFWEQNIILRGIVDKYPDERINSVYYVLNNIFIKTFNIQNLTLSDDVTNLTLSDNVTNLTLSDDVRLDWQKVEGKIVIKLPKHPQYKYGDLLEIKGFLKEPFVSKEFSYKDYLKKDRIFSVSYYPEIKLISENNGNAIFSFLYKTKSKFREILRQIIPEPNVSFLDGILFGGKGLMPEDISDSFQKTGLTHLVAVSGYNISVLVIFVSIIASYLFLGSRFGFLAVTLAIFAFIVITGAEASVVRASIMGFLVALARKEGRIYASLNSITFAGAVMIYLNPFVLRYDVGFQLSFMATLGIIFLLPLFEKMKTVKKLPEILKFKESLLVTISAQIMVLPIIINSFGRFSAFSIAANILVLPLIPYAMALGFAALGIGFFSLLTAKIFSWILWPMIFYVFKVAETFAKIDFGYFEFNAKLSWLLIVAYYSLVAFIFIKLKKRLSN